MACVWLMPAMTWAATSERDAYLRGYVEALLDSRFSGLGLRVRAIAPDGGITLSSSACLGPWQKRDIEQLLLKTGLSKTLTWGASTDCDTSTPPESIASEPLVFYALPETELFAPLLADPRQPRFSVSYQQYHGPAQKFTAAGVAFGEYFGLASGFLGNSGSSQIGIQGAVFALFNLDAPSKDLINSDYWIGLPLSYRKGPWSYLLRVYHQSSHLGDEFILGNPGVNRVNLSYENFESLASYEWAEWRVYGGGSYFLHSEPGVAPKQLHMGVEFIRPRMIRGFDFIAATDLRVSEELDWKISRSFQMGLEFKSASPRRVRLMLEYFSGHSPNGQFYREPLRYSGLGLYFGF